MTGFGVRLARHRLERGWSLKQAAIASGVGHMSIHRAESGRGQIGVFDAAKLAAAYGTTLDALLGTEITHACPPAGCGLTPCCAKTPFELPRTDRLTLDPALVTCDPEVRQP